jgi:thioredoxin reductase
MHDPLKIQSPTVAIIGGGPAGLSAAKMLAKAGVDVTVYEREASAGGIPRHADHPGYGIRDRKRFMGGPKYARVLVEEVRKAGATIATRACVTGWADEDTLEATTPQGRILIRPKVFCFATGARERPRPARMIPGDRAAGVLTTGQLQNMVHLHHQEVGKRAVIVGAELVSWSAALTLQEAGCRTAALISRYPKGEAYRLFTTPGGIFFRTRVITESQVVAVHGRGRVSGVEIENLATGERSTIDCDTVVFTGDWIGDYELLRSGGVVLDPASSSPIVDAAMRTSRKGVFAVGNINHPVETADVVAIEGQVAAARILDHLNGIGVPAEGVAIKVEAPLRWISPGIHRVGGVTPARERLVSWVDEYIARPTVVVRQDGRELSRTRLNWPAAPGRAFRIPSNVLDNAQAGAGEVLVSVE